MSIKPRNPITTSTRAAAALAVAAAAGWGAVELSSAYLVKPWEGTKLHSYQDVIGVWTACTGETRGIKPGMTFTPAQCDRMLNDALLKHYLPGLQACIPGYSTKPLSWQASMLSLAYNVGVSRACTSTAARLAIQGDMRGSCLAATAYNRAGGRVWEGLVNRREMGDAQRIGEAELCVTGLEPQT